MKITVPFSFMFFPCLLMFTEANAALEWSKKEVTIRIQRNVQAEVRTKFEFKNTGRTPVTVLGITTSCGCTVANAESSTVAAGEMSEVYVLFTIGNHHGRQEKKISVSTDDSENPETTLTFVIDLIEPPPEAHAGPVASHR